MGFLWKRCVREVIYLSISHCRSKSGILVFDSSELPNSMLVSLATIHSYICSLIQKIFTEHILGDRSFLGIRNTELNRIVYSQSSLSRRGKPRVIGKHIKWSVLTGKGALWRSDGESLAGNSRFGLDGKSVVGVMFGCFLSCRQVRVMDAVPVPRGQNYW